MQCCHRVWKAGPTEQSHPPPSEFQSSQDFDFLNCQMGVITLRGTLAAGDLCGSPRGVDAPLRL